MPGHVLKPVGLLNRGHNFFIWQALMGQSMLVREKGQTARKRGGMDSIIASRMDGVRGAGMLKTGICCDGATGVIGAVISDWG